MPEPRWSVVVPLYNKGPYIEQTLASVRAQTVADWELIVIDDGSRDDGPQRVAALAALDPRIRLIAQANAGVSAARNRGVQEARGEWVAFLDADDVHHPNFLQELAALAETFPQVELLGTSYERVPDADVAAFNFAAVARAPTRALANDLPALLMKTGMPFYTSSVAIRRATLLSLAVMFPVGESMGEDLDVWFRVTERGAFALSDARLVVYRIDAAGSLVGGFKVGPMLPAWLRLEMRLRQGQLPAHLRGSSRRWLHHVWVSWARRYLWADQWRLAPAALVHALRFGIGPRWLLTVAVACCPLPSLVRKLR